MDPNLRIAIVAFGSAFLGQGIRAGWAAYKRRQQGKEIPLKLRKGVYVPNDHVAKIERWWGRVGNVLAIWMVLMFAFLIYIIVTGQ